MDETRIIANARAMGRQRHPDDPYRARAFAIAHAAFARCAAYGQTREDIAAALGKAPHYFENTMRPSGVWQLPWWALFELAVREDIIDITVRRRIMEDLAAEAGFAVVGLDSEPDEAPPEQQTLQVMARVGVLAEEARKAAEDGKISDAEREAMGSAAQELARELHELIDALGATA